MLKVVLVEKGVAQKELFFDADEVFIGRTQTNGVMLPKPNVSKRHAVIQVKDGHVVVNDLKSTNGTWVGGRKIDHPQQLKDKDFVFIGDYAISVTIVEPGAAKASEVAEVPIPEGHQSATMAMPAFDASNLPPLDAPVPPPLDFPAPPPLPDDAVSVVEEVPSSIEQVAAPVEAAAPDFEFEVEVEEPVAAPQPAARASGKAPAPRAVEPEQVKKQPAAAPVAVPVAGATQVSGVSGLAQRLGYGRHDDRHAALRVLAEVAGREIFASVDPGKADFSDSEWLKLSDGVMRLVDKLRRENRLPSDVDPVEITQQVLFEFAGLGPLEELLSSQSVRAIIVYGIESIQVIDAGASRTMDAVFSSEVTFSRVVTKLCSLAGIATATADQALVEGHLPDGSLLQIIGRPYVDEGRMIVIERPVSKVLTVDELMSECGATAESIDAIRKAIADRRNIIVCGAPYTTRSTMVNTLAAMVPADRRILVLGGGPESALKLPNLVSMSRAAVAESPLGCARLVGRVFPDHIVVSRVESSDSRVVQELGLAGFQGMVLGMVAGSAKDCASRLKLMLQFASPGIDSAAVDTLVGRVAEVVVELGLDENGRTTLVGVFEPERTGGSDCVATVAAAEPEVEIDVADAGGPATDPGVEAATVVETVPVE